MNTHASSKKFARASQVRNLLTQDHPNTKTAPCAEDQ